MTTKVTISRFYVTVNGKRVRVSYVTGPWVEGVNPELIKIRPFTGNFFPVAFKSAFVIENNSNPIEDYCEGDSIRVLPGDTYYNEIKAVAL